MRCIIIDDELSAINVLENYIQQLPNLTLVGAATNPLVGIDLVKKHKVDVVFLDIHMDEMSGIEVMEIIGRETKIVFCTAYSEFAVQSYDLNAVDYLMKPIEFNRFVKAVQRVYDQLNPTSIHTDIKAIPNDYIFVKTEQRGKLIKINLDDIQYIESLHNYVSFHRVEGKTIAYMTLKELEERLPQSQFIRVHKSYIVSIKQITALEHSEVHLKGCVVSIPLGGQYKEWFYGKMKEKLL